MSGGSKGGDAFSRSFGKAVDVEAMRASKSAHDNEAQKEADAHPFAFCLLCRCSRCAKCEGHAVDPCKEEF